MTYSSVKILAAIRKRIWEIQELIEQEQGTGKIHMGLGKLSNQIMRDIHYDFCDSISIDELLQKLEALDEFFEDNPPYHGNLLTCIRYTLDPTSHSLSHLTEDSHREALLSTAQEIIRKVKT